MKKLFLSALMALASSGALAAQVPGKTLAEDRDMNGIKQDITAVASEEVSKKSKCKSKNLTVLNTEVTTQPKNGSWGELWTVEICNHTVTLPLEFTKDPKAGTFYGIRSTEVKVIK